MRVFRPELMQPLATQDGQSGPSLVDLMPLLEDDADQLPELRTTLAACCAHRLTILRERQLRAMYGCPLLTIDDDGAAAEEGLDTACAASRSDARS